MLFIMIGLLIGILAGGALAFLSQRVRRAHILQMADAEAARLVSETKEEGEHLMDEAKLAGQEI